MTHHTPARLRTVGLNALATAGDALANAARRANTNWDRHHGADQGREELLRELEQLAHSREVALNTVVGQLDAVNRGTEPPLWPEATGDHVADAAVAAVRVLVEERRDREAGLVSAFVSLAQRWQTTANKMEHLANQILRRYPDDPAALHDYYGISHAAATQARASQSLTVLAGKYPGRQWPQPQPLSKVVQHACARIVDYPRVQVASNPDIAVINTHAEQLIHLLAELLDNATRYSPPATTVTVTFDAVDAGWAITVHDDGHGLDAERLPWAQNRVSGHVPVGLHELGEPPQTGLAVVGTIARRHEFLVRLDSTANGGVRAVTTVPQHMLVPVDSDGDLPVTPAPRQPTPTKPPEQATSGRHREGLETRLAPPASTGAHTPGGLPIRVPQRQPAGTSASSSAPQPAPAPDPAAEGTFMADFVQGSLPVPEPETASNAPATTDSEEPR
ncbi:ATP-binding protein [Amycolatopsis sp. NPDC051371]|uniref:sensor histidine kinase n=1 Tax=Amycolatopsis sp. NPDC051371 TaxID=3155800 RepID=UPI00342B689D